MPTQASSLPEIHNTCWHLGVETPLKPSEEFRRLVISEREKLSHLVAVSCFEGSNQRHG